MLKKKLTDGRGADLIFGEAERKVAALNLKSHNRTFHVKYNQIVEGSPPDSASIAFHPPKGFHFVQKESPLFDAIPINDFSIRFPVPSLVETPFRGNPSLRCFPGSVDGDKFQCDRSQGVLSIQLPNLDKGRLELYYKFFGILLQQQAFEEYISHLERMIYYHQYARNWEPLASFFSRFTFPDSLYTYLNAQLEAHTRDNQKTKTAMFCVYLGLHQTNNEKALTYYKRAVEMDPDNEINKWPLLYHTMVQEGTIDTIQAELSGLAALVPSGEAQREAQMRLEKLAVAFRIQEKYLEAKIERAISLAFSQASNRMPDLPGSSLPPPPAAASEDHASKSPVQKEIQALRETEKDCETATREKFQAAMRAFYESEISKDK